tara:strand:- start:944 stop:1216 length:273 start_codon:yes stop_codon:yes gene_type:complete
MRTIWKYEIPVHPTIHLEMPVGAEPLSVGNQNGDICIWALVFDDRIKETRKFGVAGTGHPLQWEMTAKSFIGTVQIGQFVWHVFEIVDPQ